MSFRYRLDPDLTAEEFQAVLIASGLAKRRPVDDLPRLDKMLRHAQIIVTARDGTKLVGVSRAITDYAYCCYLSDLAVDAAYQGQGIGKRLINETHQAAGLNTSLYLTAAPEAESYYLKIGLDRFPAFGIRRQS